MIKYLVGDGRIRMPNSPPHTNFTAQICSGRVASTYLEHIKRVSPSLSCYDWSLRQEYLTARYDPFIIGIEIAGNDCASSCLA